MKFGLGIPNMSAMTEQGNLLKLGRLAEELEYDSIWVGDHIFIPYKTESRYPYSASGKLAVNPRDNLLDPLVTLAYLASVAPSPRLGISVLIIPYRNPVVTAKMLATLDLLSGGRVILGAGVGWLREEFETLGASYEDRGAVTDEYIQLFKELFTADDPQFQGKHYRVSNIGFYPKPVQKPYPPIWVGGYSLSALRRVVRLGDGWHPSNIHPGELASKLPMLRRLCREAGRDPETIEISTRANGVKFGDLGPDAEGPVAPISGTPQQMLDAIRRYEEAGVSHIVLGLERSSIEEATETVHRFAQEVRAGL